MLVFNASEVDQIDNLWRAREKTHVWTGWARPGDRLDEIWIFRKKANWRRFTLVKSRTSFLLYDEKRRIVAKAVSLEELMNRVDAIPGINDPLDLD
ncbi:MAG: hypothetical protein CMK07_08015 [Ponticaulis sp.]|nr:hypothetical protein [Ponticaulis sp.]